MKTVDKHDEKGNQKNGGNTIMAKKKKKKKATKPKAFDASKPLDSILQEAVLDKMLEGMHQNEAYLTTYRNCKRMEVADAAASRLLRNVKIKARLAYKREQLAKKAEYTAEDAIKELAKIGFANIQDFITEGNRIVDLSQIPQDKAAAIATIETDIRHDTGDSDGYTEKVKFKCHNKESALKEFLNRVQGLPKQRVEHSGVVGTRELSDEEMAELLKERTIPCEDAIAT
jgi:phage terminase small subunit